MNEKVTNAHILAAVAKLEGRFEGLGQLLTAHENNINRRLDDKFLELKEQINAHGENLDQVATVARDAKELAVSAGASAKAANDKADAALGRGVRVGAATGGGAGALTLAFIEGIKAMLT